MKQRVYSRQSLPQTKTPILNPKIVAKGRVMTTSHQTSEITEDPEFNSLIQQISKDKKIPEIEDDRLYLFSTYLREYTISKGRAGEYDQAAEASEVNELVKAEITRRETNKSTGNTTDPDLETKKQKFEEDWNQKIETFKNDTDSKINSLAEKHKEETAEFEELWSEQMPRKYRKPSVQLLQLMKIEKSLADSGKYKEAKQKHIEVQNLCSKEMEIAQHNLINDYEIAQKKLKRKQEQEINVLREARNHEYQLLISKKENESLTFTKRAHVLDSRIQLKAKQNKIRLNQRTPTTSNSVGLVVTERDSCEDVLLPPLIAPNTPDLRNDILKKQRDKSRKQREFQKKNAEDALNKYTINTRPSLYSNTIKKPKEKQTNIIERDGIKVVDEVLVDVAT